MRQSKTECDQPARSVAEGISKPKQTKKNHKKPQKATAGIFQPQKTRLTHVPNQKKPG
jgi:hypothetical protein